MTVRAAIRFALVVLVVVLSFGLAACSSGEPFDVEAVEASLVTIPQPATANQPVELQATFTGMRDTDKATVKFDVRVDDKPMLADAVYEGDDRFSGTFTFPEAGTYTVYLHLYMDDIHLTKKQEVAVQ